MKERERGCENFPGLCRCMDAQSIEYAKVKNAWVASQEALSFKSSARRGSLDD